mmetsp:Transcript_26598/g.73161  ORF Transcript_26598/g.73161 Transcript_26598/m.73161 type:complete len:365 (-) Transcript_26598:366-1460(-)
MYVLLFVRMDASVLRVGPSRRASVCSVTLNQTPFCSFHSFIFCPFVRSFVRLFCLLYWNCSSRISSAMSRISSSMLSEARMLPRAATTPSRLRSFLGRCLHTFRRTRHPLRLMRWWRGKTFIDRLTAVTTCLAAPFFQVSLGATVHAATRQLPMAVTRASVWEMYRTGLFFKRSRRASHTPSRTVPGVFWSMPIACGINSARTSRARRAVSMLRSISDSPGADVSVSSPQIIMAQLGNLSPTMADHNPEEEEEELAEGTNSGEICVKGREWCLKVLIISSTPLTSTIHFPILVRVLESALGSTPCDRQRVSRSNRAGMTDSESFMWSSTKNKTCWSPPTSAKWFPKATVCFEAQWRIVSRATLA